MLQQNIQITFNRNYSDTKVKHHKEERRGKPRMDFNVFLARERNTILYSNKRLKSRMGEIEKGGGVLRFPNQE